MAWERFQYLCRAALNKDKTENLSDFIQHLNSKPSTKLYGNLPQDSIPFQLLKNIHALTSSEQQTTALAVYAKLDPTNLVDKPKNLRRMSVYMTWVVATYWLVVSIFKVQVFPQFLELYDVFGAPLADETQFLMEYGPTIALILGAILILLVILAFLLSDLVWVKHDWTKSTWYRFCPRSIRYRYQTLIDLLHYPSTNLQDEESSTETDIRKHLLDIKSSGMNLDEEIFALFKNESAKLMRSCEMAIKTIQIVVAIIIIYMLFYFVSGVYVPIFSLGSVV